MIFMVNTSMMVSNAEFTAKKAADMIKNLFEGMLNTDRFSFRITQIRKRKNIWVVYIKLITIFYKDEFKYRITIDTENNYITNVEEIK